jgi:SAM-dependent MidA family methyltransferase
VDAWQGALYGPDGFYRRAGGPADHFRTASHAAAAILAPALARLAADHGCTAVVDLGAGRGELLNALAHATTGLRLHGVDLVPRPPTLAPSVAWSVGIDALQSGALAGALVVAWELLDTVPCPVVAMDAAGVLRAVLVDPSDGRERLGPSAPADQVAWCARWWPLRAPGERAEVGAPRERLWSEVVARAARDGEAAPVVLLAVDYDHRAGARPPSGTLSGYRGGRLVPPVPDSSCDITAHVALDAVAAAGEAAGARTLSLTDQRTALRALGVRGRLAPGEPVAASALGRVSAEAELIDPGGLGGFGWLLQQAPSAPAQAPQGYT